MSDPLKRGVSIERYKAGAARTAAKGTAEALRSVSVYLDDMEGLTTRKARAAFKEARDRLEGDLFQVSEKIHSDCGTLSRRVIDWERRDLQAVLKPGYSLNTDIARVLKATENRIIPAAGVDLPTYLARFHSRGADSVMDAIRISYTQGLSIPDVAKLLRYPEGITARVVRNAETCARTALAHVTARARESLYEQNKDIIEGYQFLATLDSRTSDICAALDGRIFSDYDSAPIPPLHPNCRSLIVPVIKDRYKLDVGETRAAEQGQVDGGETYYSWLKRQSKEYQEETLGKRNAENFRKMSAEEFQRSILRKYFRPSE